MGWRGSPVQSQRLRSTCPTPRAAETQRRSDGPLTSRLQHIQPGDSIIVGHKPTGTLVIDYLLPGKRLYLLSTGTGLAPYMSMLRSVLVCGGSRRFVILQGARASWDLGYRTELETLDRLCSNVTYIPVVSRPGEDKTWKGLGGYLQDVLVSETIRERTGLDVTPENFHIFLCGNPGMILEAIRRMSERGFVPDKGRAIGSLHTEKYW